VKSRTDAGTDIAMIGAWDAQCDTTPFTAPERKHLAQSLERDAGAGHLFLVHTGADGGGPVDVYVDEPIPADERERLVPLEGAFLLAVPTGALVVGGVEHYRSSTRPTMERHDSITVPPGDYLLRCYRQQNEELAPRSERELEKMVGRSDLRYYDRLNNLGCLTGGLTLLLFPTLVFPLGWRLALLITVIVFLAYFPILEQLRKRDPRYRRLHAIVPEFRIRHADPVWVFELRALGDRSGHRGGSVRCS